MLGITPGKRAGTAKNLRDHLAGASGCRMGKGAKELNTGAGLGVDHGTWCALMLNFSLAVNKVTQERTVGGGGAGIRAMSLEAITVSLARDNKAVFIGYWTGLVRTEKNKQSAHIKLSFHLHVSSINANNNH